MTALEEAATEAARNAERIMDAMRRLRDLNERVFGMQPKSEDSPLPPVVGTLSALHYQLGVQSNLIGMLEEQVGIAARI